MIQNPRIEAKVEGLGTILVAEYSLVDEAVQKLGSKDLISYRDLAFAQIKEGYNTSLAREDGFVKEAILRKPNSPALFVRDSPVIDNIEEAVKAAKDNERFYLSDDAYNSFLGLAEQDKNKPVGERRVLLMPSEWDCTSGKYKTKGYLDSFFYSGWNQKCSELYSWLLNDIVEPYIKFVNENGGKPFVFLDDQKEVDYKGGKPFAVQIAYKPLGSVDCSISGRHGLCLGNERVRVIDKK